MGYPQEGRGLLVTDYKTGVPYWCPIRGWVEPKLLESVSEQLQNELEPLPDQKWDGGDIGEVLKHGRE